MSYPITDLLILNDPQLAHLFYRRDDSSSPIPSSELKGEQHDHSTRVAARRDFVAPSIEITYKCKIIRKVCSTIWEVSLMDLSVHVEQRTQHWPWHLALWHVRVVGSRLRSLLLMRRDGTTSLLSDLSSERQRENSTGKTSPLIYVSGTLAKYIKVAQIAAKKRSSLPVTLSFDKYSEDSDSVETVTVDVITGICVKTNKPCGSKQ